MSVEKIETLRKKARNIVVLSILLSLLLSFMICVFLNNFEFIIFIFSFGIVISFLVSRKPTKAFKESFKSTFVLKSLQNYFDNLEYNPDCGIEESVISSTGMMKMGDRYSSNDYVSGTYKNIKVIQSDIHIEEEHQTTDSDGNTTTTWVTIFKGRWMIFDFNKLFKTNIEVCQKGFSNSKLNNFGLKDKYKKVQMEDQDFNNKFRVYAQSDHEAFYILTPSLMEKIKKLSIEIKGKMLLCFIDNKLHVGIHNNKDSFEHSIFKKIDEQDVYDKISKDIKLITDFVDKLNLDNDLFRKEV